MKDHVSVNLSIHLLVLRIRAKKKISCLCKVLWWSLNFLLPSCFCGGSLTIPIASFRLALERSKTAREALEAITSLLLVYGQGGRCSEEKSLAGWAHHNSFLMVDSTEGWVLETVGPHWAAERLAGKHWWFCVGEGVAIIMKSKFQRWQMLFYYVAGLLCPKHLILVQILLGAGHCLWPTGTSYFHALHVY